MAQGPHVIYVLRITLSLALAEKYSSYCLGRRNSKTSLYIFLERHHTTNKAFITTNSRSKAETSTYGIFYTVKRPRPNCRRPKHPRPKRHCRNVRAMLCTKRNPRSVHVSAQPEQRLFAGHIWVAKDPKLLPADSEDSDQTVWMHRLIWVYDECNEIFVDVLYLLLGRGKRPFFHTYS